MRVDLTVGGRQLRQHGRKLPTGSSALDVSMTITGNYRPPPYLDMDVLIEDSINRNSANLVKDLKDRGGRSGTRFFESVEGLDATAVAKATSRPTVSMCCRWSYVEIAAVSNFRYLMECFFISPHITCASSTPNFTRLRLHRDLRVVSNGSCIAVYYYIVQMCHRIHITTCPLILIYRHRFNRKNRRRNQVLVQRQPRLTSP
jgi:hypothetical protein